MDISRRAFLGGSAAVLAGSVLDIDQPPLVEATGAAQHAQAHVLNSAPATMPTAEVIALNRIAYGPRPGDIERVQTMGLAAYVDEQLNPNDSDDADCLARIATATLHIQYAAGTDYPAVDEDRPLETLDQTLDVLWQRSKHGSFTERYRPVDEVRAATWLRAIYSKWQLREVLMEFWLNHFNVNTRADSRIAATWPLYVYGAIKPHCFGKFRDLLEAVAQSIAMQYYLDNATSRDGPANENYARELFELHTLGSDNYFNDLYDRWQDVPGAQEGSPAGYIDVDVYEAARAFTGWTIADGKYVGSGSYLPDTGEFMYYDGWHDNAQKRVLATEFLHNAPPLQDGHDVLDLVARHPGTARHICKKLCQRLVADQPAESLVQQAVAVWLANVDDAAQIQKTLRTIILSAEFSATWGKKVKRPFELQVAFLRAIGAEVTPNSSLFYRLGQTGYAMFDWPTPTGMPDIAAAWLSTNTIMQNWNTLYALYSSSFGAATFDLRAQIPATATTSRQIVDYWVSRMLGYSVDASTYEQLLSFMAQGEPVDQAPVGSDTDLTNRINNLVMLIAMTPDFQWR